MIKNVMLKRKDNSFFFYKCKFRLHLIIIYQSIKSPNNVYKKGILTKKKLKSAQPG